MREKKETENNDNSYHREDESSDNMKTMINHPIHRSIGCPVLNAGNYQQKRIMTHV